MTAARDVQTTMFPDPAAERYEAACTTYEALYVEHRTAVAAHYVAGTLNRRDYLAVRDRCEEAAREMLRLRPCSETLDTP